MNRKRQLVGLAIVITLLAGIAFVLPELLRHQNSGSSNLRAGSSLRFAQLPITYSAVTFLADANGYYRLPSLNYRSFSVPAGPDVVTALRGAGPTSADAGGIAVTPVVTMIGAGDQPVVLATTLTSNSQAKLITFQGLGILKDPATLKGKRIGVVKNTIGEIYLSRLLHKGGLNDTDVTIVNGRPADLRSLLVRGDIDAAVIWDPFIIQAERQYEGLLHEGRVRDRGKPVVFVDPTLYTLAFNIVTTRAKLAVRRVQLTQMLEGTIKAEAFIRAHPKEAQHELEQWLGLKSGDLDDFMATTDFHVYLNVPKMEQWMQEELAWLAKEQPGTVAVMPHDFSSFVDASLLKSIDPSRVTQ